MGVQGTAVLSASGACQGYRRYCFFGIFALFTTEYNII